MNLNHHAQTTINPAFDGHNLPSVIMRELSPGAIVTLDTANSRYRIVVINGETGEARIQGGSLFPDETETRIDGSTTDGLDLHEGTIDIDKRLAFTLAQQRGLTSRVRAISIDETHD